MKGRLNSILWRAVTIHGVALLAIFFLAYGAGARSGGLSILDFGALPSAAGLWLWAAALIFVFAVLLPVWMATRILHPLKQLTEFSEGLGATGDGPPPPIMETNDDFSLIAERLRTAAEQIAAATTDQNELASLRQRIAEFAGVAEQAASGDLTARAATGDDDLGRALASVNLALEAIGRLVESARALAERVRQTADTSIQSAQQCGKTLAQQERDLAAATESFAVLPPSVKQAGDNSSIVVRAAQSAGSAAGQAREAASGTQSELQKLTASLRSSGDKLANLRHAAEHVASLLRPLSAITERANLLALNAVLDAARSGQAGRTSTLFAEQFRELAGESSKVSGDVAMLVESIYADCGAVLDATERDAQASHAAEAVTARAVEFLQSVATAAQEASARSEVVSLASARQADAARNVTAALQSAMDMERLAAQQTRQSAAIAEQLLKSVEELKSALAAMRIAEQSQTAAQSRAAVSNG